MWSVTTKIASKDGDFDRGGHQLPPRAAGAGRWAARFLQCHRCGRLSRRPGVPFSGAYQLGRRCGENLPGRRGALRDCLWTLASCCIRPLPPTSTPPSPAPGGVRARRSEGAPDLPGEEQVPPRAACGSPRDHCEATPDQGNLILKSLIANLLALQIGP